jgi:hypothetical protein
MLHNIASKTINHRDWKKEFKILRNKTPARWEFYKN